MDPIKEKFKLRGLILPNQTKNYKIYTYDDIAEKEISKVVEKAMEIFEGVSVEDCKKLLYDFNWDCNTLFDKFTEAESFNDFLQKNKIDLTISLSPETMINSFIYSNPLFKKCPRKSKTCDKVVKVEDSALTSDFEEICCDCSYTFCFKCTNMPHSPFPCILVAEYIKQCKDYEMILDHNNTICDQCCEVFDVNPAFPGKIICTNCNGIADSSINTLDRPSVFPDYKLFVCISDRLDSVFYLRDILKDCRNAEFMTTAAILTENFLQRILPFPIFWFFLDKEYLSDCSSTTTNIVPIFDFSLEALETILVKLMSIFTQFCEIRKKKSHVETISDNEENNVLDMLYQIQQHLDKLLKYIDETKGWIFKIPEIQVAFEKINEERENDNEMEDKDAEDDSVDNEDGGSSDSDDMREESFVYIE